MHLKEQKAFTLIREILGRQPRLPINDLHVLVLNTDLNRCGTISFLFLLFLFCLFIWFSGTGQPPISVLDVS